MKRNEPQSQQVTIELPKKEAIEIIVVGETPYVGSKYADETRKNLLMKQSGKNKTKSKDARNIEVEVNGRRHIVNDKDCIPASAFRSAMIDVAKDKSLAETSGAEILRSVVAVQGDEDDFIPILNGNHNDLHPGHEIRDDVVTIGRGQKHIAYRPEYRNWSAKLTIIFIADRLNKIDILNLLARAGMQIGVGDNRKIGGGRFYLVGNEQ